MTEDIYRVKDELLRMVYDQEWGGFEKGVKAERERILHLAESLICFEHHKGCDHAACYAISNLISHIKEGNK